MLIGQIQFEIKFVCMSVYTFIQIFILYNKHTYIYLFYICIIIYYYYYYILFIVLFKTTKKKKNNYNTCMS